MEKELVKDNVFALTQNPALVTCTNNSWYENTNIFCKKVVSKLDSRVYF